MLAKKCRRQCQQQEACPFIQDKSNPEQYVCQICGLRSSVERIKIRDLFLLIRIIILVLGFVH